jgi:hypothetical protein
MSGTLGVDEVIDMHETWLRRSPTPASPPSPMSLPPPVGVLEVEVASTPSWITTDARSALGQDSLQRLWWELCPLHPPQITTEPTPVRWPVEAHGAQAGEMCEARRGRRDAQGEARLARSARQGEAGEAARRGEGRRRCTEVEGATMARRGRVEDAAHARR